MSNGTQNPLPQGPEGPKPGHDPDDDFEDDELEVGGSRTISDLGEEDEDAAPDQTG